MIIKTTTGSFSQRNNDYLRFSVSGLFFVNLGSVFFSYKTSKSEVQLHPGMLFIEPTLQCRFEAKLPSYLHSNLQRGGDIERYPD